MSACYDISMSTLNLNIGLKSNPMSQRLIFFLCLARDNGGVSAHRKWRGF